MKIAFTVTGPDLARALSRIAEEARGVAGARPPRTPAGSTVSPAAARELAARPEAADEQP